MAVDNNQKRENQFEDKKNLVVNGSTGKKRIAAGAAVFVVALLIAAGAWYTQRNSDSGKPGVTESSAVDNTATADGGLTPETSVYDAALFGDGSARFFSYRHQGINIRYFILKGADGAVRAAFDACDVCWRAGKGYTQRGDVMVCINCGRQFPSEMIGTVSGGCNPAPLDSRVSAGKVVIRNSDIVKGLEYFKGI